MTKITDWDVIEFGEACRQAAKPKHSPLPGVKDSDDAQVIKRLREPPFGTETSERLLMLSAAETIERLQGERDDWKFGYFKTDKQPDVLSWLDEEISAIDTWYRGSPSYEHDAGWMKDAVRDLLKKAHALFGASALASLSHTMGVKGLECHCTKIEQDETCPVGYPSLLCEDCDGKGIRSALTPTQQPEPEAYVVKGPGWKRVFLSKEAAEILAKPENAAVTPLYAALNAEVSK